MSARNQKARLARLPRFAADRTLCIHHGDLCAVGTRPLPDFYVMVIDAKRRAGQDVPPLDHHRAMTAQELADHDVQLAGLLAEQRAKNERTLARLDAEQQARDVVEEVPRTFRPEAM